MGIRRIQFWRPYWGPGGEVALLGTDVVARVERLQVDGAEGAVLLEFGWPVDEEYWLRSSSSMLWKPTATSSIRVG